MVYKNTIKTIKFSFEIVRTRDCDHAVPAGEPSTMDAHAESRNSSHLVYACLSAFAVHNWTR